MKTAGYRTNWGDRLYLKAVGRGLKLSLGNLLGRRAIREYPEAPGHMPPGHRGAPRLTRDERGRVRCVACHLCATVCPAACIHLEAAEAPWEDREKYPRVFEIDMLRCVYCGLCAEACPAAAIDMSGPRPRPAERRSRLIFDGEGLLGS